ncbi:Cys-tRNA(Pro) deacylase [Cellulosilyticum sp. I15G10I2]|uniref:Cys-tRNA(Pro) deacylase n=1 Tax=Cellulosilyticum sp. I15G10I2 TaxID=1892843 RepID=UPI00085C8375|nr:Cys-tRNA(Pro) deacylase [Cellulosilyticum sp. I15G10I2]
MPVIKTNAMRILDKAQITYEVNTYDTTDGHLDGLAVAKKINKDPEQVFKTLVASGHSKINYIFVIPVGEELDLKKGSALTREKSIEMLPLKELQKTTGYVRGGCSPIGMKKLYKTYIHDTAQNYDSITLSGGKVGVQITLSPISLKDLVQAEFQSIIK